MPRSKSRLGFMDLTGWSKGKEAPQSQMRRVIDDVASGKLRDVREIARALRGS